jgi:hypothetical protein
LRGVGGGSGATRRGEARRAAGAAGARQDRPLEAKRLGGKRSAAARRAKAVAAQVAELMAELMDELASWVERLEAERLEGGGL